MKVDVLSVDVLEGLDLASFERDLAMHWLWRSPDPERMLAEVAPRVRGVQATGKSVVDAALIGRLPRLEIISSCGVGYDGIDVAAAKRRGVVVTNTPDVLNDCVADLAFGLLIASSRRIAQGDRLVRSGEWVRGGQMPVSARVSGKRLGLLGLGRIGRVIAHRASGFDMPVAYHARHRRDDVPGGYEYADTPVGLAERSDFLVVATPGGPQTRHLVDEAVLRALGPQGILVNVARGSVVDEEALVRCLREGAVGGAGLDVFEEEPLRDPGLRSLDSVVLMPHVGSATRETRAVMSRLTLDNLLDHFAGRPVRTPV